MFISNKLCTQRYDLINNKLFRLEKHGYSFKEDTIFSLEIIALVSRRENQQDCMFTPKRQRKLKTKLFCVSRRSLCLMWKWKHRKILKKCPEMIKRKELLLSCNSLCFWQELFPMSNHLKYTLMGFHYC